MCTIDSLVLLQIRDILNTLNRSSRSELLLLPSSSWKLLYKKSFLPEFIQQYAFIIQPCNNPLTMVRKAPTFTIRTRVVKNNFFTSKKLQSPRIRKICSVTLSSISLARPLDIGDRSPGVLAYSMVDQNITDSSNSIPFQISSDGNVRVLSTF